MLNLIKRKTLLKEKIFNPTELDIMKYSYRYALFQANLKRFIPSISDANYENLYKHFLYYQGLTVLDQYDIEGLNKINFINNSSFDIGNQNCTAKIFATFHYGSYRLINSLLLKNEFKIVLIIDDPVYKKQKTEIELMYQKFIAKNKNSDFIILNVKEPSFIFKTKSLIAKGYHLIVYLDGNTSSLKNKNFEKGFTNIDFFDNKIFVKNGVAILSFLLKVPIIPVLSRWDSEYNITLEMFDDISFNAFYSLKDFTSFAINHLYSTLQKQIAICPIQWECWSYIHEWFERDFIAPYEKIEPSDLKYVFNDHRYCLFKFSSEHYFFDKITYRAFPLSEQNFNFIQSNKITQIESSDLIFFINKNLII